MLKKSDVQALLDRMPDEFAASHLIEAIDDELQGEIDEPARAKAEEALQRIKREGGLSIQEFEEKMESWHEQQLSPTKSS